MNYITEIKAFHDLVQSKQLSTGQIALWYALMYQNNKCAWTEWFTVPNITLELNCGLSKSGIHKARNILKQHEVIDFKTNGTRATSYKIISQDKSGIDSNQESGRESNRVGNLDDSHREDSGRVSNRGSRLVGGRGGGRGGGRVGVPLNKLNDTKLNETIDKSINIPKAPFVDSNSKRVFDMWQSNIGIPSAIEIKNLSEWIKDLSVDAVCYAIEVVSTLDYDKRNYRYINGILNNWAKQSLTTVEAIKAYELSRQKKNVTPGNLEKKAFVKRTAFNSMQGRDWDFEELAKLEAERRQSEFGEMDGLSSEEIKRHLRVVEGGAS